MSHSVEPRSDAVSSDVRPEEPPPGLCCGCTAERRGCGDGVEDRDVLMTKAETQAQNPLLVQAGVR